MLTRVLLHVLMLAQLGAGVTYAADTAARCPPDSPAVACRYARGILWKIERAGQKPSYLFGTIHISDTRVTTLPAPVRTAFNAAHSFAMELIFDGAGMIHMAETMFFDDGRTLDGVLGAQRYAEVRRLLDERGVPLTDLKHKKPWVVVMLLSAPRGGGIALDLQLQLEATLQSKPTHGLETVPEQISVFNDLPMDDQVALLDDTLRYQRESEQLMESMVQAYLARDLPRIMAVMDSAGASDKRLQQTVMERLLSKRNVRMLERMRPRLEQGNAFIAVGAGHLAGDQGLLPLLESAGWRVTPVY